MITFVAYWLMCGLLLFYLLFGQPIIDEKLKDYENRPGLYIAICLALGGFLIPYIAFISLLEK